MSSSSSSLYPKIDQSNPDAIKTTSSSSSSLYPSLDMKELSQNLFPDNDSAPTATQPSVEETLVTIPGSIVHLIDDQHSVELASGVLTVVGLRQGDNVVAVLLRVGQDTIQWPLAKDEPSVKLDQSHYFFSLRIPDEAQDDGNTNFVNYGVTIASKGQEKLLKQFDEVLDKYSSFSVQKVVADKDGTVLDDASDAAKAISPVELKSDENKELMKDTSAAYWTTLAPNVEDYNSCVARAIASGSGSLIKGILWCGNVTVDRLKWGNEFMTRGTARCSKENESQLSPATLRRIKRAKRITKMSEQVAMGILSGVVKVSGFFTSSIVNSKAGSKFFSLLPGEIVLASLDGFSRVFDAVEVAGKNVMSTTSTVTTGIVSHKYGEQAGGATTEGLDAAGHAIGTAWAVLKIRSAINPKNVVRPSSIAKTAAKALAASQAKTKTISK